MSYLKQNALNSIGADHPTISLKQTRTGEPSCPVICIWIMNSLTEQQDVVQWTLTADVKMPHMIASLCFKLIHWCSATATEGTGGVQPTPQSAVLKVNWGRSGKKLGG